MSPGLLDQRLSSPVCGSRSPKCNIQCERDKGTKGVQTWTLTVPINRAVWLSRWVSTLFTPFGEEIGFLADLGSGVWLKNTTLHLEDDSAVSHTSCSSYTFWPISQPSQTWNQFLRQNQDKHLGISSHRKYKAPSSQACCETHSKMREASSLISSASAQDCCAL